MVSTPYAASSPQMAGGLDDSEPIRPYEPIAIVGVGMRASGGINDMESLWDTLIGGKSHNARLIDDPRFLRRFDPKEFEEMFGCTPDSKEAFHCNLLDETPGLDEGYFGVSARDSACMDVQHKLLLHVAHEAMEDAGFTGQKDGSSFDPDTFGCWIGSATDDFIQDPKEYGMDIYHLVRKHRSFMSGQVSHNFGLRGPSVSVDTVCSSSMTAFNNAIRALSMGECRAALTGGVHVMSNISAPPAMMSTKLAGFLDPKGQCKPFRADGGGYCRAEASGLMVLVRLSDAIRDNHRIHGVIRGVGVGNMAHSKSIVRPDGHLQSAALARAIRNARINVADISYVEAHGPGTQAGDPAELESISTVVAPIGSRPVGDKLVIGSIKGNVGHSEAASGSLSLFKVLAMLKYQTIAPQANFDMSMLNPRLKDFVDNHELRISDAPVAWDGTKKRVAVVNNFGASAKDNEALHSLARSYADWLDGEGASKPLADVSYSMTARRMHQRHSQSVFVQASTHAELAQKLRAPLSITENSGPSDRPLVFCFSGQGGPPLDPRKSALYGSSTTFTSAVDLCLSLATENSFFDSEDEDMLDLFALEYALAKTWEVWGVVASAVVGHSFGEYVALVHSGALQLRDALRLVGFRASLVRSHCMGTRSKMAALRLPLPEVEKLLASQTSTKVELACSNTDDRVTLAGLPEELSVFQDMVRQQHPTARWVPVDNMKVAFHSRFVDPLLTEFEAICGEVQFSAPTTTFLSGTYGSVVPIGDASNFKSSYLPRHCRNTNKFGPAIASYRETLARNKASQPDWIELGPHSTVLGFVSESAGQLKLPSHRKGSDGWTTMLDSLISLRRSGHSIDFGAFYRDVASSAGLADLPRYPFRLQPHTYTKRRETVAIPEVLPPPTVENAIPSEELAELMRAHSVAGYYITPASVYMCLALGAAAREAIVDSETGRGFRMHGVTMHTSFTKTEDDTLRAYAVASPGSKSGHLSFEVSSDCAKHANMQVELCDESRILSTLRGMKSLVWPLRSLMKEPDVNVLDTRLAYALFNETVVYGSHCQGIKQAWISAEGHQAWSLSSNAADEVEHRQHIESAGFRGYSPILIDRACQIIGMMVNTSPARASDEIFVASEIDSVEMAHDKVLASPFLWAYTSFEIEQAPGPKGSTTAVGQVFTFDSDENLVAVFRGIRMRKMKRAIVAKIVAKAAASTAASSQPVYPTPAVVRQAAPQQKQREQVALPTVVKAIKLAPPPVEALPVPDAAPLVGDHNAALRDGVLEALKTTLELDDIPFDKTLAELGLDSLTAVEAGSEIERLLPLANLPPELLGEGNVTIPELFKALRLDSNIYSPPASATVTSPPALSVPVVADVPVVEAIPIEPLPAPPSMSPLVNSVVEVGGDDDLRQQIVAIFETTLEMESIPLDQTVGSLGLDSLTAVEVGVELERLLPDRSVPADVLGEGDITILDLFDMLDLGESSNPATPDMLASVIHSAAESVFPGTPVDVTDPGSIPRKQSMMSVLLSRMSNNPEVIFEVPGTVPLLLIHDGGGTALAYRLLAGLGRTLLGIHSPGFADGIGINSIRHAAELYAGFARSWVAKNYMKGGQPGKIMVGGWSLGGTIAMTLAAAHPEIASGVILIDSPPPGTAAMLDSEVEFLIPILLNGKESEFGALVRRQLCQNAASLAKDSDRKGGQKSLVAGLSVPVYLINAADPVRKPGEIPTPKPGSCSEWMASPDRTELAELAWQSTLGQHVIGRGVVPGDHFSILTPSRAATTTKAVLEAANTIEEMAR